jgi:hypothetical protein
MKGVFLGWERMGDRVGDGMGWDGMAMDEGLGGGGG